MQLPHVTFGGVENKAAGLGGVAQATLQVGAEAERATGVIAEGLAAYGRELVKTQTQQAAIDLEEGLSSVERDLQASPYVSRRQLRARLGDDLDGIPPELRQQVDGFATDPVTGQVDDDKPLIPTWAVAGVIYDRESKRLVEQASKRITTGGWAAEFQDNARRDLVRRQAAVDQASLRGLHAFLVEQHSQDAMRLAKAGNFDAARAAVARSDALDPAQKLRVLEQVETIETPVLAQREASQVLAGARRPGSQWLDEAKALEAVAAIPDSNPRKKLIGDLAKEQIALSDAANRRAGEDALNQALSFLEQGASLNGPELAPLKKAMLDPANGWANHWATLKRGVDAERARLRAEARADRQEIRLHNEEQARATSEAVNLFLALPPEDRAGMTDEGITAAVAGLDEARRASARAVLMRHRQVAREKVQRGEAVTEAEIRRSARSAAEWMLPTGREARGKALGQLDTYVTRKLDEWSAANPGKKPDGKVQAEIIAQALLYGDAEGSTGGSIWSGDRYAFQVPDGEAWSPFGPDKQPRKPGAAAAATSTVTGQRVPAPAMSTTGGVTSAAKIPVSERARLVREYRTTFNTTAAPSEAALLKAYNAELSKLAAAGG